ncbi:MAG: STAS domain-containing protein [Gammaproteobacteria bacterium]|nr:STAS domain-containing protein [Gammaproteobacteria bacterium]
MYESTENPEGDISFDDTLDITLAATYYEKLNHLLNEKLTQKSAIVLNAGNIERIDGAGLQLLAAFCKAAELLHISIEWQGCSEAVKKSAELSGLTGSLKIE